MNKIVKIGILAVLILSCALTGNAYVYNERPSIGDIYITTGGSNTNQGDNIAVTAYVYDSDISEVTFDSITIRRYYGNIYKGVVPAKPGYNNVVVRATDWAGNSVLKRSVWYYAKPVPIQSWWFYRR